MTEASIEPRKSLFALFYLLNRNNQSNLLEFNDKIIGSGRTPGQTAEELGSPTQRKLETMRRGMENQNPSKKRRTRKPQKMRTRVNRSPQKVL